MRYAGYTMGTTEHLIRRLFKVEPGEGPKVLGFALLGALLQAGVAIGMSTADALFLANVGVERLPYVYLLTPLMMLAYAPVYTHLLSRYGIDRVFDLTLGLLVAGGIGFFLLVAAAGEYPASAIQGLYYLVKLYSVLWYIALYSLFWNFADSFFDIQDAKRLFAFFSGGGAAGAMLGGALVVWVTRHGPVEFLFLLWSLLSVLAWPVTLHIRRSCEKLDETDAEPPDGDFIKETLGTTLRAMAGSRYVALLILVSVSALVLTTVNEYQYLEIFSREASAAELAALFGRLFVLVNIFNLVVNLLVFNRLVLSIGVGNVALIQPITYVVTFIVLILDGGPAAAVFGFFAYHGILTSIEYNNQNFLFNGIPAAVKKQVRTVIEGLAEPFSTALGGLLLLLLASRVSPVLLSTIGLVLAGVYLVLAFALRSGYLAAMVTNLRNTWLDLSRPASEVIAELTPDDLARVRVQTASTDQEAARTALRILWRNDRRVALHAALVYLEGPGRGDLGAVSWLLDALLAAKDIELLREALDGLTGRAHRFGQGLLQELAYRRLVSSRDVAHLFRSYQPDALAAALVASWNSSRLEVRLRAVQTLDALAKGDEASVCAALRAVAHLGETPLGHLAVDQLSRPGGKLRRQAILALRGIAAPGTSYLARHLLAAVRVGDEVERRAALTALSRIGDPDCIVDLLEMGMVFTPPERRRVAAVLVDIGLKSVPSTVSVLRNPHIPYPGRAIAARALAQMAPAQLEALSALLINEEIARAYAFSDACGILEPQAADSKGMAVMSRFYRDMRGQIVEFILEILTLGGRLPDFEMIGSWLRSDKLKERANALETIEQGVSWPVFKRLAPLLDERGLTGRRKRNPEGNSSRLGDVDAIIARALEGPFPLECAAAAQALWERSGAAALDGLRDRFRTAVFPVYRETVLSLTHRNPDQPEANPIEKIDHLARSRFFGPLPIWDLEKIAAASSWLWYDPGEYVFRRGVPAEELALVLSGGARLKVGSRQRMRGPHDTLGEESLFGQGLYTGDAVADGMTALVIRADKVLAFAASSPRVGVQLLRRQREMSSAG